ncbi:MAG: transcription termination factor NusA [bacterium]
MNAELTAVLNFLEKERGIDRETLVVSLESALLTASRKSVGPTKDLRVEIDRKTCDIRAIAALKVVEHVESVHDEISILQARKIKPDAEIGEMVEVEVTPKNFGRIAAQTAKQAILQKLRQAEKDVVYEEYKDRIGDIVTGSVLRFERSDIVVDLGRAKALLASKERVPTEEYQVGDRIRAYIQGVDTSAGGTAIQLSRSHPNFVKRLFELEIAEIADGTVEIKGIAREPGYRTKVAVVSKDPKVDSVGACVGMRGVRVKNIVRELSGEKIDIVRWSDDVKTYVTNALSPAKLLKVSIDPDFPKLVNVVADADQLSLAIGKRGQNVRLTAKLIGWKINIQRDETKATFDEKVAHAVEAIAGISGMTRANAEKLVQAGFLTIEGILAAEAADLEAIEGFDKAAVDAILDAVASHPSVQFAEKETSVAAEATPANPPVEAKPE